MLPSGLRRTLGMSVVGANLTSVCAPMSGVRLSSQAPIARSGSAEGTGLQGAIVRAGQPGRRTLGGQSGGILVIVTVLTKSALQIGLPGLATDLAYVFFLQRREIKTSLACSKFCPSGHREPFAVG
jgi:hypothetical protein